mgnify:CR=1 FL=1
MAKKQKVVLCRNCNSTMAKGTKICHVEQKIRNRFIKNGGLL